MSSLTFPIDDPLAASPGNVNRPTSSTACGTFSAFSSPLAGDGTATELDEAEPQLASPPGHGESVLRRVRTPCKAHVILEPLQLPASSVFIELVVSRMIATLYGPLNPPFALAIAVDEIVQLFQPSARANVVGTVAVSVTRRAL